MRSRIFAVIVMLISSIFLIGIATAKSSVLNNFDSQQLFQATTGTTTRVSVASDGAQGNDSSENPSIAANGRYVVFQSDSSNLVSNDTNGDSDVFVNDRQIGAIKRVSVASDGTEGNDHSGNPFISADGQYIIFNSIASNLVSDDTNNVSDVFLHNIQTDTTTRVSVASDGTQGNGLSGTGAISNDGRYIVFYSEANNLVSNDTNFSRDIFVHDRQMGTTTRVSIASDGTQGNDDAQGNGTISDDGRFVAFDSSANNLFDNDTNGRQDVFVHDRQTGETSLISAALDGIQGNHGSSVNPVISGNGRYVAFQSYASYLVNNDTNGSYDIFVHDRQTGVTKRVSVASDGTEGNGSSQAPSVSGDGRYISFYSFSNNLVPNDTNNVADVFVHDILTGMTTRASIASDGTQADSLSAQSSISNYGRYVAFESGATNLVNNDTNGNYDIFVHDRAPDLLFRPNPDGYQFANPGYMQPMCSDFQRSYSGLSIQCTNNQPQQEYQALFKDYRDTFSTGVCTGMAASSLLYYTGAEPLPQTGTTFDLDASQAQANIATYHGRQHSKAVLDIVIPSWASWTDDSAIISQRVDDVYNQIKASLSSENNNPLVLDLFPRASCGTSGHTIVPYRLDDTDPLHPKVYVYENFNPNNANKFIQFDLATSIHSFSYWLWDSTSCGTLVAIPVNTFTSSDGKIPGTQLHVSTGGNVEPLLTNSMGEMVGYNNGELTATITDAMPVFPWHTPGITSTVTSFLAPPDMYTTTLSSSGGGYTFTVWSSSGTLKLQADGQTTPLTNNLLSTTNPDLISFDADLHSAILSTSDAQGQSVTLQMSIPDTDNSQVYTLDNVNLLAGGNLNVDALDSELRLTSNSISTNYDVYFDRISTQTLSAFAHADLTLLVNDKHFLTFSDGDGALLKIDHGGDGSIDETVVLENQADTFYKIYLPTILR